MWQFDINLTKMANERTVVENASEHMLRGLGPELGQRYAWYLLQTGNLYATGYALAADEVRALIHPIVQAVRRALHAAFGRLVRHQPSTTPARSQAVARLPPPAYNGSQSHQ